MKANDSFRRRKSELGNWRAMTHVSCQVGPVALPGAKLKIVSRDSQSNASQLLISPWFHEISGTNRDNIADRHSIVVDSFLFFSDNVFNRNKHFVFSIVGYST